MKPNYKTLLILIPYVVTNAGSYLLSHRIFSPILLVSLFFVAVGSAYADSSSQSPYENLFVIPDEDNNVAQNCRAG